MVIPSIFYPFLISSYTLYASTAKNISYFLDKATFAYSTFFTPKVYVFCKGYLQPILYKDTMNKNQCSLYYNVDKGLFYPTNMLITNNTVKYHTLPILSMEIINADDNVVYDLTNFIEDIRYIDIPDLATPTTQSIVMIWATLNNNYPDPTTHRIRYIDMSGDDYIVNINGS